MRLIHKQLKERSKRNSNKAKLIKYYINSDMKIIVINIPKFKLLVCYEIRSQEIINYNIIVI